MPVCKLTPNWTSSDQNLGFDFYGFPEATNGAAKPFYSSFRVSMNGWLMLTDGTQGLPASTQYEADLRGQPGNHPIIAPFWTDLVSSGPDSGVHVATSTGRCTITWRAVKEKDSGELKNFQVIIFQTGEVEMKYDAGITVTGKRAVTVGVACRNGVPCPVYDLSAQQTTALTSARQVFEPEFGGFFGSTFDIDEKRCIRFAPVSTSATSIGFGVTHSCCPVPAHNLELGIGSYAIPQPDIQLELYPDAMPARLDLEGKAVEWTNTPRNPRRGWIPPIQFFPPPTWAISLPPSDDGEDVITLSTPMPTPWGTTQHVTVGHNGILTIGKLGNNRLDYTPTTLEIAESLGMAYYSFRDFNDTAPQSGRIKHHESGGVLYVTWDGVASYGAPGGPTNSNTWQFQVRLSNGNVACVWQSLNGVSTSSLDNTMIVGYTGRGRSIDIGSVDLATYPQLFAPHNIFPVTLTALGAPISTSQSGSTVTFDTYNIPEFMPNSGMYLGTWFVSFSALPSGADLGFIGAPGTNFYLGAIDIDLGVVLGPQPRLQKQFQVPSNIGSIGLTFYTQALCLFDPVFPLPNGANAAGLCSSNAIESRINTF